MKGTRLIQFIVFPLLLLNALGSCGLKYVEPPGLEEIEASRRAAIENNYASAFAKRGYTYKPLTYGELVVVKPDSYRKLDSLFARKYALQEIGTEDAELNSLIERQRDIALNDSSPVLYVETHWFELDSGSTFEFLIHSIRLNRSNKIIEVNQLQSFPCSPGLAPFARLYMKEDPFVYTDDEYTSNVELEFYSTYKEYAATLSGRNQEKFISHTLELMRLASIGHSLSVEVLLNQITQPRFSKEHTGLTTRKITVERIFNENEGKQEFAYYQVTFESDNTAAPYAVYYYDAFLQQLNP